MKTSKKIQPLDKTVVLQFQVHVADLHMRTRQLNAAQSARVGDAETFTSADANITTDRPAVMTGIKKVVIIHAWKSVFISLRNESGLIERIPCTGTFIMYGSFDEVTVSAQAEGDPVRITYLFA
jgi:hypothetical protein